MSQRNDTGDARAVHCAGVSLYTAQDGAFVLEAPYNVWEQGLSYQPKAVNLIGSSREIRIEPGLAYPLETVERDGQVLARIVVPNPPRSLRRIKARSNTLTVSHYSRDGYIALIVPSSTPAWTKRIAANPAILAVASVALLATGFIAGFGVYHYTGNTSSRANDPSAAVLKKQASALVAHASHGKAHVKSVFSQGSDIEGVIITGNSSHAQSTVGWLVGYGSSHPKLIIGDVFNQKGQELTGIASKAHQVSLSVDAPNSSGNHHTRKTRAQHHIKPLSHAILYKRLSQHKGVYEVSEGGAKHNLYVFMDPNCKYCHALWQNIQAHKKLFKHYGVAVHWVPVGILFPTSKGRAEAILKAGYKGLANDENHFVPTKEQGGIAQVNNPQYGKEVRANTALLARDGIQPVTPTMVWKDHQGIRVVPGSPPLSQIKKILQAISGHSGH